MKQFILIALSIGLFTSAAKADVVATAELCNESGVCTPIPPNVAVLYLAISELIKELNKPDSFGRSNDLVRAIVEIDKLIKTGMGPTNDFRRFIEQSGIDQLLRNLGIQLFT